MAQANVLREFLVRLGFKTDETSLKKFKEGIEATTKAVGRMAIAVEGAAIAVGAGVVAFASRMEDMYFASKKTGATATNIKALQNTLSNFGVSNEEALGSLQSLARFMRNTPAAEGFLKSLGVQTRGANGQLLDTVHIMANLGKAMRGKPFFVAAQYAQGLGISEDVLRAMMDGDFDRQLEQQQEKLKNSGYDKAAEDAHKFEERLRDLEGTFDKIKTKVGGKLLDKLQPELETLGNWFDEHADQIADWAQSFADGIVEAGKIAIPILKAIGDGWARIWDWMKVAGDWISDKLSTDTKDKIGEGVAHVLQSLGIQDEVNRLMGLDGGGSAAKSGQAGSKERAVHVLTGMGWTKAQAAGIVASIGTESGFNPAATGDNGQAYGIAQWHPDRQAAFKAWSGHDIHGSSFDEQLAFMNYELTQGSEQKAGALLRASQNARQAGEIVSRYYERPAAADAQASLRGNAAVQIAQTTHITVTGSTDPQSTATQVASAQDRVNQNLTRNLKTAVN